MSEENDMAWVELAALKPWADNPRKNDAAVKRVADSIKRFGFASPIVARRADGEIIAGHTRYKAAQMLGLGRVPVKYVDLDPADARLLALADNKLNEFAEWDQPALQQIMSEYSFEDLDLAGWDQRALDLMAADILNEPLPGRAADSADYDAPDAIMQLILVFDRDGHKLVVERLEKLKEETGAESFSDAVLAWAKQ